MTPEISIILPCCNEEENVAPLLEEIQAALAPLNRPFEVIYVDDASTDRTAAEVRKLCVRATPNAQVRLLRHKERFGQSASILTGYQAARGKYFVTMDADLQNDPADIPALLKLLESGADCVCGIRQKRHDSFTKKITSRIANKVRDWALHDHIRDAGCSLRIVRREATANLISFRALHRFLPSILLLHGYKIDQMPVRHRPRVHGRSKYGTLDRLFVGISDLRGMRWYRKRCFAPNRILEDSGIIGGEAEATILEQNLTASLGPPTGSGNPVANRAITSPAVSSK